MPDNILRQRDQSQAEAKCLRPRQRLKLRGRGRGLEDLTSLTSKKLMYWQHFDIPGIYASLHPQLAFRESAWHSR